MLGSPPFSFFLVNGARALCRASNSALTASSPCKLVMWRASNVSARRTT